MAVVIRAFRNADAEPAACLFRVNTRMVVVEPAANGFVQGEFAPEDFIQIAEEGGVFVAADDGRLVGFVCSGQPPAPSAGSSGRSSTFPARQPVSPLSVMLERAPTLVFRGHPVGERGWICYGPIVVDAAYRGRGIARALREATRARWHGQARVAVLFIEKSNTRSLGVHLGGLGMDRIGEYTVAGRDYLLAAFGI